MTSQEAVDFVYKAKMKMANYTPTTNAGARSPDKRSSKFRTGGSPTKLNRNAGASPTKRKNRLEAKLETSIDNSKFKGLACVVEMMMDVNCPVSLANSDGLGADNMTCVIVEFK